MFAQNRMGRNLEDIFPLVNMIIPYCGISPSGGSKPRGRLHRLPYDGILISTMTLTALCCPDKFRGSLTAAEAAAAMAAGLRAGGVAAVELALADGGEGTLDVLLSARKGRRLTTRVSGPLGDPVDAEWGLLADGTAVIEMARASGLALTHGRNDPLRADTHGTGELLRAAAAAGARRAIVTLGGSASTDGGLGALEALGWSLHGLDVTVACDVETRFVDAARVFGPQKGAGPAEIAALTGGCRRWPGATASPTCPAAAPRAGSRAGSATLGATLRSGFDVVADAVGLRERLEGVDLVVTGEGALDASSLDGKVVGGVLATRRGRRGPRGDRRIRRRRARRRHRGVSLTERAGSPERAIREAAALVREPRPSFASPTGSHEPQWPRTEEIRSWTWHRRSR